MALKTDSKPNHPQLDQAGHTWLVRGERVHLSCGGEELPVEWWDGNDRHQRPGGRWWTPQRATALHRWTSDAERDLERILTSPAQRERAIMDRVQVAWTRKVREQGGSAEEASCLPDPLPPATVAWVAQQLAIADELAALALDAHPKLAGDRPAWLTLRHCVARDERWLMRAVELGVLPAPPMAEGKPILPVSRLVPNDDQRMRAAEELARDMVAR